MFRGFFIGLFKLWILGIFIIPKSILKHFEIYHNAFTQNYLLPGRAERVGSYFNHGGITGFIFREEAFPANDD